jgi:glycosyltransferase involved in cell wall biosynthesis
MTQPLVSIVIPTRNGGETLPSLFGAVAHQRVSFRYEIVAVDSGSTDGSLDLIRRRADRLIEIAADRFDHGLTRNLGVEQARGELVVQLVQDAVPADDRWLAELTAPLLAHTNVAGVFARQRPRFDASPITRYYHERWVAAADADRVVAVADSGEFDALQPMDRFLKCAFDNVCSCIRRSVWERHPFRSTPIAEDLEWAREVLLAGHRLVYAPKAVVVHSHDRPARYEFARTYLLHRRLYELFELRTIPTIPRLARAVATSIALHMRCQRAARGARAIVDAPRAIALALAWPLGQYCGGLSAARGWRALRSRTV